MPVRQVALARLVVIQFWTESGVVAGALFRKHGCVVEIEGLPLDPYLLVAFLFLTLHLAEVASSRP